MSMSFPYDPTLPSPPDDPADDVSGMQTNAASIASLIAVDHSGFNIGTGGTHEQVTYSSNNAPMLPTTFPVSFTDLPTNYGGAPAYAQQFFFSGTAAQSKNQYVLTGNGSVLLAGGIILKWGSGTLTLNPFPAGGTSISFSVAFPNNVFTVYAVSNDTGTGATANTAMYARPASKAAFNLLVTLRTTLAVPPPLSTVNYSYFAIGN